jgi:hypothetical protein
VEHIAHEERVLMDGGMFLYSAALIGVAREAYSRTQAAASDTEHIGNDALVAIVFSAAALEGFLNEMAELAGMDAIISSTLHPPTPPSVAIYGRLAAKVEEGRGSITLKFLLARGLLNGELGDKGSSVYEDFRLLVELRNELVHLKPSRELKLDSWGGFYLEPAKVIKRLRAKGVLAVGEGGAQLSWLPSICTRAAARWACNTAADTVHLIVDGVPECALKVMLSASKRGFQRVA